MILVVLLVLVLTVIKPSGIPGWWHKDGKGSIASTTLAIVVGVVEAKREYAVAATEAFREVSEALAAEQRAHQETSAEAERYWLGWRALDRAWDLPVETKVKVKEDG